MTKETEIMLKAFDALPNEEKQAFAHEILRRSLPFASGPLDDQEISTASARLIEFLES